MVCGSVGIGRRARLRILWWSHRVGSSPIFRIRGYGLCIKNSYGLRKCRNWQTSKIQVLVSVTLVRVQVPSSAWLKSLVYRGFFISACSGLRRGLPAGCYAEFHPGIRSKETVPADTRERPEAADSQPSQPSPQSCRRRNCSGFHALRLRAGVHQRREIP